MTGRTITRDLAQSRETSPNRHDWNTFNRSSGDSIFPFLALVMDVVFSLVLGWGGCKGWIAGMDWKYKEVVKVWRYVQCLHPGSVFVRWVLMCDVGQWHFLYDNNWVFVIVRYAIAGCLIVGWLIRCPSLCFLSVLGAVQLLRHWSYIHVDGVGRE